MVFIERVFMERGYVCVYAQINEHPFHMTHPKCMLDPVIGLFLLLLGGGGGGGSVNVRFIQNVLPKAATVWLLPTYRLPGVFPCRNVAPHILVN